MTRSSSFVIMAGVVAVLLVICGMTVLDSPLGGAQPEDGTPPETGVPLPGPGPARGAEPSASPGAPPPAGATASAVTPGWQLVVNPSVRLAYEVPPDWQVADPEESLVSSNGVRLTHLADWGTYTCQGAEYGRAFAGSGIAGAGRLDRTASELAASIAADQYSDGEQIASVTLSPPRQVSVAGARGVLVRAEATSQASSDQCTGDKGTVAVLALPAPTGNAVFVVGADTVPGREQPLPLVGADLLTHLVNSVRPTR